MINPECNSGQILTASQFNVNVINNIEYLSAVKVFADPNDKTLYFFHKRFP